MRIDPRGTDSMRMGKAIRSNDLIQRMEVTIMAADRSATEKMSYDGAAVEGSRNLTELVRDHNISCEVRPKYMGTSRARRQWVLIWNSWGPTLTATISTRCAQWVNRFTPHWMG